MKNNITTHLLTTLKILKYRTIKHLRGRVAKTISYMADFETITTSPTRVWLWALCPIQDITDVVTGTSIDSFIEEISKRKYNKSKIYFHNLKFDGTFIVYYLLTCGKFEQVQEGKLYKNSFTTLISRMGQWYQIKIKFDKCSVTIQDSLKKLPFSVRKIAKDFNLSMSKGEIDYAMKRDIGYVPTAEELDYIYRDIGIVAQALNIQFEQGLTQMTIGSDALREYKDLIGKFRDMFPLLKDEVDTFCRKSYKGGYVYCNPMYQGMEINEIGQVFDVNSMYPWAMHEMPLPYGEPIYFTGKYFKDNDYPLYICHIIADFSLKPGMLPTVQVKNNPRFLGREYIKDSKGHLELYLTSVDLDLFLDNYYVWEIEYIDGYKFRSTTKAFKIYIDKWMEVKANNTGALRALAKLMLNSLYGKFAKNPDVTGKHPVIENDRVKLVDNEHEISETNYIPVGCFITAWARWNLINSALVCKDRFCYCDTDSIHIIGLDPVPGLNVHPTRLGAWKQELVFTRAKYLHTKCYMEEYEEDGEKKLKVTVSGLPAECRKYVTFENFKPGAVYGGKLLQKNVPGGVILVPTEFTIKDFPVAEPHKEIDYTEPC